MIVQHQSEARKRPSITALTTMWADQNICEDAGFRSRGRGGCVGQLHRGGRPFVGGRGANRGAETGSGGVCAANRPKLGLWRRGDG